MPKPDLTSYRKSTLIQKKLLDIPEINIPDGNNWKICPSPTGLKSLSKSLLMHYVPKIGGCIRCFMSSGNETI